MLADNCPLVACTLREFGNNGMLRLHFHFTAWSQSSGNTRHWSGTCGKAEGALDEPD
jgi:hypothetical protein